MSELLYSFTKKLQTQFRNERHLFDNETCVCNDGVRLCHILTSLILYFCSLSHLFCFLSSSSLPLHLSRITTSYQPLSPRFSSLSRSLSILSCISLLHHLFFISGEQAAAAGGEGAFSVLPQWGNSDCGRWSFLQRCEKLLWGKSISSFVIVFLKRKINEAFRFHSIII